MDPSEEKELIGKARNDRDAFGRLFEEYYPRMFGYALKRTGIVQVAEDVTSEVFYKAQKNLWQFTWRSIPFSAWLYRIAANEINHYFRKGIRHRSVSLNTLMEDGDFEIVGTDDVARELQAAEKTLERHQTFLAAQKEIAKLPLKYQEVIALRFFEHKKIGEMAVILGKKEGTVKSLLSRGVDQLRVALADPPEPGPTPASASAQPSYLPGIIDSERSL
jgi:RNA polymerase sigma factor (sigma-70 family)